MANPKGKFQDARLKVEWANCHINYLMSALNAFLQTNFCELRVETDTNTGNDVLKLISIAETPAQFSLIIGDTIHNLSTALDYVTTAIVGSHDDRITFPMHEERHNLVTSPQLRSIEESAPHLVPIILDDIKPYKTGNYPLWATRKLDNFDKHKLLIPTLRVTQIRDIHAEDGNRNRLVGVSARMAGGGQFSMWATGSPPIKITSYGKPSADIFFAKGHFFEDQPVIPTLRQLVQVVLDTIGKLEVAYFGTD